MDFGDFGFPSRPHSLESYQHLHGPFWWSEGLTILLCLSVVILVSLDPGWISFSSQSLNLVSKHPGLMLAAEPSILTKACLTPRITSLQPPLQFTLGRNLTQTRCHSQKRNTIKVFSVIFKNNSPHYTILPIVIMS